jgi:hypothetical protein
VTQKTTSILLLVNALNENARSKMMKKLANLGLVITLLMLLTGCNVIAGLIGMGGNPLERMLPLTVGATWTYTAEMTFYDEAGTGEDSERTISGSVTLFIDRTETVAGINTFILKAKDFTTSALDSESLALVNEVLGSSEVSLAHDTDGLKLYGGSFVYAVESTYGGGETIRSEVIANAEFFRGIPIIPGASIGEPISAEESFENNYIQTDSAGIVRYQSGMSINVSATSEIKLNEDVTTNAGTFSAVEVESNGVSTVTNTYYNAYTMNEPEVTAQTVTVNTSIFVAEDVGMAKVSVTIDYGSAASNVYQPKAVSLELAGFSGLQLAD